ncbi:MAG: M48 family metalloprotease [Bdellovibrionales bacterium]|nr:M48 family metalloprotease [Bdellovibrionales bacterium]
MRFYSFRNSLPPKGQVPHFSLAVHFLFLPLFLFFSAFPALAEQILSSHELAPGTFALTEVGYVREMALSGHPSEAPVWTLAANRILHTIAGDDTVAFFGFSPEIQIVSNPLPHAFVTSKGELTFSSGILGLVESSSEFAFLLAHEAAHGMLGHAGHAENQSPDQLLAHEIAADAIALRLLSEAGYEQRAAVGLLRKLQDYGKEYGTSLGSFRPSLEHRRLALLSLLNQPEITSDFLQHTLS